MVIIPERKHLATLYQEDPPITETVLQDYFDLHRNYLALLRGDLRPIGTDYDVTSYFYYGRPVPPALPLIIYVQMPISSDGAQHARDSHSLITAFLLGIDAQRRECATAVVLHFFGKALEKAIDIERQGQLKGDLLIIRQYLEGAIRTAKVEW
jgi:hypothetical protein